ICLLFDTCTGIGFGRRKWLWNYSMLHCITDGTLFAVVLNSESTYCYSVYTCGCETECSRVTLLICLPEAVLCLLCGRSIERYTLGISPYAATFLHLCGLCGSRIL